MFQIIYSSTNRLRSELEEAQIKHHIHKKFCLHKNKHYIFTLIIRMLNSCREICASSDRIFVCWVCVRVWVVFECMLCVAKRRPIAIFLFHPVLFHFDIVIVYFNLGFYCGIRENSRLIAPAAGER